LDVAVLVGLAVGEVVAHGVKPVHRELGMVPVDDGVIEAEAEALLAKRVHQRVEHVALGGGVGGLVVGQR